MPSYALPHKKPTTKTTIIKTTTTTTTTTTPTIFCYWPEEKPELYQLQCMCYTSNEGKLVYFRLMDRIQPKWTKLAIALKFPSHKINTFKLETEPVFTLLSEWLKGGNRNEDPSSVVTWGTLITALRYAGLEEEAEIIEKQFFETMAVQEPVSQKGPLCMLNFIFLIGQECM